LALHREEDFFPNYEKNGKIRLIIWLSVTEIWHASQLTQQRNMKQSS